MFVTAGIYVVTVTLLVSGTAAGSRQQFKPSKLDIITIDGSKNPELVPDHVMWRYTLSTISIITKSGPDDAQRAVHLSASDMERVVQTASWYKAHFARCAELQEKKVATMRHGERTAKDIDAAQKAIILDCRQRMLERVDALLLELSAEGRQSLINWAHIRRTKITATVPRSELAFYRQPR